MTPPQLRTLSTPLARDIRNRNACAPWLAALRRSERLGHAE